MEGRLRESFVQKYADRVVALPLLENQHFDTQAFGLLRENKIEPFCSRTKYLTDLALPSRFGAQRGFDVQVYPTCIVSTAGRGMTSSFTCLAPLLPVVYPHTMEPDPFPGHDEDLTQPPPRVHVHVLLVFYPTTISGQARANSQEMLTSVKLRINSVLREISPFQVDPITSGQSDASTSSHLKLLDYAELPLMFVLGGKSDQRKQTAGLVLDALKLLLDSPLHGQPPQTNMDLVALAGSLALRLLLFLQPYHNLLPTWVSLFMALTSPR